MKDTVVWEILVPKYNNDGEEIPLRKHQEWDSRVRERTGGLTVYRSAVGQWHDPEGRLYTERMIPVRVIASPDQMLDIARDTLVYYEQKEILYYKISDEVHFVNLPS